MAYKRHPSGLKTPSMKEMEGRINERLEEFILKQLKRGHGDRALVAKSMSIDSSTLGRWIERLGIRPEVNEIRLLYGRSPSIADPQFTVGIHTPKLTAHDEMRLGPCLRCHGQASHHNGVVASYDPVHGVVLRCPEKDPWAGAARVYDHEFEWVKKPSSV